MSKCREHRRPRVLAALRVLCYAPSKIAEPARRGIDEQNCDEASTSLLQLPCLRPDLFRLRHGSASSPPIHSPVANRFVGCRKHLQIRHFVPMYKPPRCCGMLRCPSRSSQRRRGYEVLVATLRGLALNGVTSPFQYKRPLRATVLVGQCQQTRQDVEPRIFARRGNRRPHALRRSMRTLRDLSEALLLFGCAVPVCDDAIGPRVPAAHCEEC